MFPPEQNQVFVTRVNLENLSVRLSKRRPWRFPPSPGRNRRRARPSRMIETLKYLDAGLKWADGRLGQRLGSVLSWGSDSTNDLQTTKKEKKIPGLGIFMSELWKQSAAAPPERFSDYRVTFPLCLLSHDLIRCRCGQMWLEAAVIPGTRRSGETTMNLARFNIFPSSSS